MKKLYTEWEYRRYHRSKLSRVAKRSRKRKTRRKLKRVKAQRPQLSGEVKIKAPAHVSLLNNVEETIAFFEEIRRGVIGRHVVDIDFSSVRKITSDALLYLVALFDHFKMRGEYYRVKGNFPLSRRCKILLIESGFFRYVKTEVPIPSMGSDTLKISRAVRADGKFAKEILEFVQSKIPSFRPHEPYRHIVELMTNTRQHAFEKNGFYWYSVAIHNPDEHEVWLAFMDNGVGIHDALSRDWSERVMEAIPLVSLSPSKLLLSALEGHFRTRTEEGYRGKGLPRLYESVQANEFSDMVIISDRAYIDFRSNAQGHCKDLDFKFHGTLYSWIFREGNTT